MSESNYKSVGNIEKLQDYLEECRAELAHMEDCMVDGSVTFFDILTALDIAVLIRAKRVHGRHLRGARYQRLFSALWPSDICAIFR